MDGRVGAASALALDVLRASSGSYRAGDSNNAMMGAFQQLLGLMDGISLILCFVFLAGVTGAALAKRWFPRGAVTAGLLCFFGLFLSFLANVAVGALTGRLPKIGRNTGILGYSDSPEAFWILIGIYVAIGVFGIVATIYTLRRHVRLGAQRNEP